MEADDNLSASSFSIGSVRVRGRAVLAPLSGVTDVDFRRVAQRFGAALVVSEMVASDDFVRGRHEAILRAEGEGVSPHVVQLAGCEPGWMEEAARLAEANGADIIDINMGCPAKRVTGGYAGSALMRDLDLATRIVKATRRAVTVPVTVKMRLGWDHASLNAPELARRAEDLGIGAVTVHGRTRQQFYKGAADWRAIGEVVRSVRIPVIANGDIGSAEDAALCLAQSGAAAVMVGRAAMGRPWHVGAIDHALDGAPRPEPEPALKLAAAREHYLGLVRRLGREIGVRHARKHLAAYADLGAAESGQALAPRDRAELVTADDPERVLLLLERVFAPPLREAA